MGLSIWAAQDGGTSVRLVMLKCSGRGQAPAKQNTIFSHLQSLLLDNACAVALFLRLFGLVHCTAMRVGFSCRCDASAPQDLPWRVTRGWLIVV